MIYLCVIYVFCDLCNTVDLFLGLFSGFGRHMVWEVDNAVEFVQICGYFMVIERFLFDIFRTTLPPNYLCEVLFALKFSGYLHLARSL